MTTEVKDIREAAYWLDFENEYIANRGTFWRSGGDAQIGQSASSVDIEVGGTDVTIGSDPYTAQPTTVTLADGANTGRLDLIHQRKRRERVGPRDYRSRGGDATHR